MDHPAPMIHILGLGHARFLFSFVCVLGQTQSCLGLRLAVACRRFEMVRLMANVCRSLLILRFSLMVASSTRTGGGWIANSHSR